MGKTVKSIKEMMNTLYATAEMWARGIMKMESDTQQQQEIYKLALEAILRSSLMKVLNDVATTTALEETRKHLPELVMFCSKVIDYEMLANEQKKQEVTNDEH